jgi:hypothetical protein
MLGCDFRVTAGWICQGEPQPGTRSPTRHRLETWYDQSPTAPEEVAIRAVGVVEEPEIAGFALRVIGGPPKSGGKYA